MYIGTYLPLSTQTCPLYESQTSYRKECRRGSWLISHKSEPLTKNPEHYTSGTVNLLLTLSVPSVSWYCIMIKVMFHTPLSLCSCSGIKKKKNQSVILLFHRWTYLIIFIIYYIIYLIIYRNRYIYYVYFIYNNI